MRIRDWSSDVCSSDLRLFPSRPMPDRRRRPRRGTAPDFSIALAAAMGMLKAMNRMRPWLLALMLLALAPISAALAECTDPPAPGELGSAPLRESVCQYVSIPVVAVSLKNKQNDT